MTFGEQIGSEWSKRVIFVRDTRNSIIRVSSPVQINWVFIVRWHSISRNRIQSSNSVKWKVVDGTSRNLIIRRHSCPLVFWTFHHVRLTVTRTLSRDGIKKTRHIMWWCGFIVMRYVFRVSIPYIIVNLIIYLPIWFGYRIHINVPESLKHARLIL